jgi:hypothetical protein
MYSSLKVQYVSTVYTALTVANSIVKGSFAEFRIN